MDIISISGIVLGLVAVFSQIGLPSRFKALVALIIAVGVTLLMKGYSNAELINGVIAGLTASGLWSGVKSMKADKTYPIDNSTVTSTYMDMER